MIIVMIMMIDGSVVIVWSYSEYLTKYTPVNKQAVWTPPLP